MCNINYSYWPNERQTPCEEVFRQTVSEAAKLELKQHKPWFDEECLGFWIQGSRLKCNGYRIQAKTM
jgi:hypothetical protein